MAKPHQAEEVKSLQGNPRVLCLGGSGQSAARAQVLGGWPQSAVTFVSDESRFEAAIERGGFDLIVVDCNAGGRIFAERLAQVKAAERELEEFAFSISHDLRAPLRGLDGFARALEEDCSGQLDSEGLKMLAVIRTEARTMGLMLDGLLAYSRVARQRLDLCEIDMTELSLGVFQELAETTTLAVPKLVQTPLPSAFGDRRLMREVFSQLLNNAIKFTQGRSNPQIEILGSKDETRNTYCVRDNGVGFESSHAGELFNVFQTLHRREEYGGAGIGLAIVRRVIRRHGGTVRAEAKAGEGASFIFELPRRGASNET